MSETTATGTRTRRRASRQAGPPVEDERGDSTASDTTGKAVTTVVIDKPEPKTDAPSASGGTPGATAETVVLGKKAAESESAAEPAVSLSKGAGGSENSDTAAVATAAAEESATAAEDAGNSKDAAEPEGESRKKSAKLGPLGVAAAIVAVVSSLVLAGSVGFYFYHQHRHDALVERRAEYVQVAKQAVIDLSTIKGETAGQDIDRLLSVASGDLKAEYTQNKDVYTKIFEQVKIQSTGTVLEAAIESEDADSARVLILAQQTVSNAGTNQPQLKDYRFRVTVTRGSNGVTASALEWVA